MGAIGWFIAGFISGIVVYKIVEIIVVKMWSY